MVGVLALVLIVALFGAVWAAGPFGAQRTDASAPAPGVQPAVHAWFQHREVPQIELNNALVAARQLPRQPGAATPICARLAEATQAFARLGPVPVGALEGPIRAGLDTFDRAAAACLTGDLAMAEQLIAEGLAERTAAQQQVDEILDGDGH